MKKLIFGALLALSVLLLLPGAVSAVGSSDTITVNGLVVDSGNFEVTVTNDVSFGTMTAGNTYSNLTTDLTVNSTFASWSVSANDQDISPFHTGRMVSGTDALTNLFKINVDNGAFQALPFNPILSGTNGKVTADIGFQQQVVSGDKPGAYSITVVFTGSAV